MNTDTLVNLAERYCEHSGLKLSTVSTYSANDGKWLALLKSGAAGCTLRKAATVISWFSDHWPADLEWPRDIDRPKPSNKEAA